MWRTLPATPTPRRADIQRRWAPRVNNRPCAAAHRRTMENCSESSIARDPHRHKAEKSLRRRSTPWRRSASIAKRSGAIAYDCRQSRSHSLHRNGGGLGRGKPRLGWRQSLLGAPPQPSRRRRMSAFADGPVEGAPPRLSLYAIVLRKEAGSFRISLYLICRPSDFIMGGFWCMIRGGNFLVEGRESWQRQRTARRIRPRTGP